MDSDDESDEISQLSAQTTDPLRDSLGKKPSDRTENDVEVSSDYISLKTALALLLLKAMLFYFSGSSHSQLD